MADVKEKELLDFLEQFNKKYESEHAKEDKGKSLEELRPATPPDIAPCQWGYPCNNCGQC